MHSNSMEIFFNDYILRFTASNGCSASFIVVLSINLRSLYKKVVLSI